MKVDRISIIVSTHIWNYHNLILIVFYLNYKIYGKNDRLKFNSPQNNKFKITILLLNLFI